jgi:hypothetical protein
MVGKSRICGKDASLLPFGADMHDMYLIELFESQGRGDRRWGRENETSDAVKSSAIDQQGFVQFKHVNSPSLGWPRAGILHEPLDSTLVFMSANGP